MFEPLVPILDIQEVDMKMLRLMKLKQERQKELKNLNSIRSDLKEQVTIKESQVLEAKKDVKISELDVEELNEKIKKFEEQQSAIKKVDEFNALTQEISTVERQRHAKEQGLSDMYDKVAAEEDILNSLRESLQETETNSQELEEEIFTSIRSINEEGQGLKVERDKQVSKVDPEIFSLYERLLKNKQDRVVVPLENRCCSGCHIVVTAQHENLVRKGERVVFCEHCSRIHYWAESEAAMATDATGTKKRRRKTTVAS